MNANLDELLREGMERFTADLHAPADLANRARRHRNQRLALRTAVSCAAAIALIAIVVAAVSARTAGHSRLPTAPAWLPERSDVEFVRLTGLGPASPLMIWTYGGRSRQLIMSSAGRPREDDGVRILPRHPPGSVSVERTIVEFATKTWGWAAIDLKAAPPRVGPTCAEPQLGWPDSPASLPRWVHDLRKAVNCGDYVIVGTERINGVDTIKLVATSELATGPGSVRTIWITHDVPVRMTGGNAGHRWRADISWLRPTRANQARLRVPIPAGFRRVSILDFPNAAIPTTGGCRRLPSRSRSKVCTILSYLPS